jgi:hypothetical protein
MVTQHGNNTFFGDNSELLTGNTEGSFYISTDIAKLYTYNNSESPKLINGDSWTFGTQKFNTSGIVTGTFHGLFTNTTTPRFNVNTSGTTSSGITISDLAPCSMTALAPKDCYLSMVQCAANFSGGYNVFSVYAIYSGGTQIELLHEAGMTGQTSILTQEYIEGDTFLIPEGSEIYVLLKVSATGIYGHYNLTLKEV